MISNISDMTIRITFDDLSFYSTLGEHSNIILTNTKKKCIEVSLENW